MLRIINCVDSLIIDSKLNALRKQFAFFKDAKFIPYSVQQKNNSFNGLDSLRASKNKSLRNDFRAVKRNGYHSVFTRDEKLLNLFYNHMYTPHIINRHKVEALVSQYNSVKKSFDKGGLVLLKQRGRIISGGVVEFGARELHVKYFGILNGNAQFLKNHALSSLYYFCFKIAQDNSLNIIDLGYSKAFLNDGVLRYKTKWHTHVEFNKERNRAIMLKIINFSTRIKAFLLDNPFISIEDNKNLVGNIFLDNDTIINKEKCINRFNVDGLDKLRVVFLNGSKTPIREEIIPCKL